jgi:Flp pilus assembly pilin Flp
LVTPSLPSASAEPPSGAEPGGGERGAGLVEYALLISLIVLVCIAAVSLLGDATRLYYSSAVDGLDP